MSPTAFPEANTHFKHPEGYTPEQVASIPAFFGNIQGGSMDGAEVVIVAWQPSQQDLLHLLQGKPIYVGFLGGFPAHFACSEFPLTKTPQHNE